jgi:hypothetical protein
LRHSVFPDGEFPIDPLLVFVAMPFAPEFDALYEMVENLVVDHCHLRCLRADAIARSGSITAEIWRHVNEAMCVIADLSGRNANVFYEVGLAHAIGKPVVLLSRDISDVPFDLRHLRIVQYDQGTGFRAIRSQLLSAIRSCLTTLPQRWDQPSRVEDRDPLVRISGLLQPETATTGQPVEIIIRARTDNKAAREGYFSVSFPDGVEDYDISILQTDVKPHVGRAKEPWCSGRVILEYPIAEVSAAPWESHKEHFMKVQFKSRRRGWLRYYVSASSSDEAGNWAYDPGPGVPHIDQRGEHVVCGFIDLM